LHHAQESIWAQAWRGLLGAASWGLGDELPHDDQGGSAFLPFDYLFPVTFEACGHQFHEETSDLFLLVLSDRIAIGWTEFLEES